MAIRRLIVVLGDQLNLDNPALRLCDPNQDLVWVAEVAQESTKVWSHKARIVMFLSAMRHFKVKLEYKKIPLFYRYIDDAANTGTLYDELKASLQTLFPQEIHLTQPGEWQVQESLKSISSLCQVPLYIHPDDHFLCSTQQFESWAKGQASLRMEYFYRWMRSRHEILMENAQMPLTGVWNYDRQNRGAFGQLGPLGIEDPISFPPDDITQEVIAIVETLFPAHPGNTASFDFPVTSQQAEEALEDFINARLPLFGQYQDAMWDSPFNEPYLAHSRLSAAMNLKLLNPREVIQRAVLAYKSGKAPIQAVEGFIRQILGWREYVRGIYWLRMPAFLDDNVLQADRPLPAFYWSGDTNMHCLKAVIGQTLEYGYAHHIQRLMITGLFALLLGVNPKAVHEWYLAIYIDAVEWVELPNTIGMSQFADGGFLGSKPYIASGKYIARMSNYCQQCKYDPDLKSGDKACPFNTLYWNFLLEHKGLLARNERTRMQVRNLQRLTASELQTIREESQVIREKYS